MNRSKSFIDREFQLKYARKVFWFSILESVLIYGPAVYLINSNYELIKTLTHQTAPNLLRYMEREQVFMNLFALAVIAVHLLFVKLQSRSLTSKVVAPIKKMRNHIRLLSRGKYSSPPLKIREDDEFHDLVASYNYFLASLADQTERDLFRLKEVRKMSTHPILSGRLDQMIEEKTLQLGLNEPNASLSLEPSPSGDSRHAS